MLEKKVEISYGGCSSHDAYMWRRSERRDQYAEESASEGEGAEAAACGRLADPGVPRPAKRALGQGRHPQGGSSPYPAARFRAKWLFPEYIRNGPFLPLCFCIFKIAFTHLFLKSCHISGSYQAVFNLIC